MIAALDNLDGWQAGAILVKSITYGASLAAAGGIVFLLLFGSLLQQGERQAIARQILILSGLGIVFTVLRLDLMAGMLSGSLSGLGDWSLLQIIFRTGEGTASEVRVAGLLLTALVATKYQWRMPMAALGAALTPLSFALTGHAAASQPALLPQTLLTVHLLCVAYWIGALWPLRFLMRSEDLPRISAVMTRFGNIAAYTVGTLVGVGVLLLWWIVPDIWGLPASDYGRLVGLKLGVVAILLALAAANKLRLVPALERGDTRASHRLKRSIMAEMLAVGLILVVTATFTTVTGPTEAMN